MCLAGFKTYWAESYYQWTNNLTGEARLKGVVPGELAVYWMGETSGHEGRSRQAEEKDGGVSGKDMPGKEEDRPDLRVGNWIGDRLVPG